MAQTTKLTKPVLKEVYHFVQQVKQANIPIDQIIVFGSHAKGTPHPWSDIDVCVTSSIFGHNRYDELINLSHLTNDDTFNIEPHPMHPKDLENKYDTLATEINRYGIPIKI